MNPVTIKEPTFGFSGEKKIEAREYSYILYKLPRVEDKSWL